MLLHVLMRAVAGFLRSCAEFLLRHAETDRALPAMETVRLPGPPEDWTRRANPPPPAHWVDLVRRRAPRFLATLPEAARAISAGDPPAIDGSRIHRRPVASAPFGPRPVPVPARDRKDGATVAPPRVAKNPIVEASPRRVRVVTSLQESARRPPSIPQVSEAATEAPKAATTGDEPRSLPLPARPTLAEDAVPVMRNRVEQDPEPERMRPRVSLPFESEFRRPGIPEVEGLFAETRSSRTPDLSFDVVSRSRRPEAASFPRSRPVFGYDEATEPSHVRNQPVSLESAAAGLPVWPELPTRPGSDPIDDGLALVREQRRLDARNAEQRGNPWNV